VGLAGSHDFGFDEDDVSNRDEPSEGSSVSPRQASDSHSDGEDPEAVAPQPFDQQRNPQTFQALHYSSGSSFHESDDDYTLKCSSPLAIVTGISQVGVAASHDFGFDENDVSNRGAPSKGSSASPRQTSGSHSDGEDPEAVAPQPSDLQDVNGGDAENTEFVEVQKKNTMEYEKSLKDQGSSDGVVNFPESLEQDEPQTKTDTIESNSPAGDRPARRRRAAGKGSAGRGKKASGRARGSGQHAGVDNESSSVELDSRSSRESKTSVRSRSTRKSKTSVRPRSSGKSKTSVRSRSSRKSASSNSVELSSPLATVAGISQVGLAGSHDFGFDEDDVSNRDGPSKGSSVSPPHASDNHSQSDGSTRSSFHGSEDDNTLEYSAPLARVAGSSQVGLAASHDFGFDDNDDDVSNKDISSKGSSVSPRQTSDSEDFTRTSSHGFEQDDALQLGGKSRHSYGSESIPKVSASSNFDGFGSIPKASASSHSDAFGSIPNASDSSDSGGFGSIPKASASSRSFGDPKSSSRSSRSSSRSSKHSFPLNDSGLSGAPPDRGSLQVSSHHSRSPSEYSRDSTYSSSRLGEDESLSKGSASRSASQQLIGDEEEFFPDILKQSDNAQNEFSNSREQSDDFGRDDDFFSGTAKSHASVDFSETSDQDSMDVDFDDDFFSKSSQQPSLNESFSQKSTSSHQSRVDETKQSKDNGVDKFDDSSYQSSHEQSSDHTSVDAPEPSNHNAMNAFDDSSSKASQQPSVFGSTSKRSKGHSSHDESEGAEQPSGFGSISKIRRSSVDASKSSLHEGINKFADASSSKSSLYLHTSGMSRSSMNESSESSMNDSIKELEDLFSSKSSKVSFADDYVSKKSKSSHRSSVKPGTSKSSSNARGGNPSQRHSKLSRELGMEDSASSSSRSSISKRSVPSSASSVKVYNSERSQSERSSTKGGRRPYSERSRVKSSVSSRKKSAKNKESSVAKSSRSSKPSICGMESFLPTILETAGVNLSDKMENVYSSVQNKGYLHAVDVAYEKLLGVRPRLNLFLSQPEWRHIHVLMLYARIFDCEMAATNVTQPIEFRIAIPEEIKIFEPLARILSGIGIVEDPALGVRYIPVARTLREEYRPHDPDDVTEFLEWTQYDWKDSWTSVEKGRADRRMAAIEKGMTIPEAPRTYDVAKLLEWENLALEKWLGWDDKLWLDYEQAAHVLMRRATFVGFPSEFIGTYAWLIPREEEDSGFVCRIPKASLPTDIWLISLLLDLSALPPSRTCTWYFRTTPTKKTSEMLDEYIGTSIK
jgi:hypothetical protein